MSRPRTEGRARAPSGWLAGERLGAAAALAVVAIFAAVALVPLAQGRDHVDQLRRDHRALTQLDAARVAVGDFQIWVEPVILQRTATIDSTSEGTLLFNAAAKQTNRAVKALTAVGLTDEADQLRTAIANLKTTVLSLSTAATDPTPSTTILDNEHTAFAALWSTMSNVTTTLRRARDDAARRVTDTLDTGYRLTLGTCALAAFAIVVATVVGGQRARRRRRIEDSGARRAEYEAALQDGLDMSKTEAEVYAVSSVALHESIPELRVQMLIADSSRAHFTQMLGDEDETGGGCGVISPVDCPAATRGHTLVFPDSRAINACPYLRNRPAGDCSAVCVPVNIAGTTVGVTHAWGTVGKPPERSAISYLEITSRRTSERLSMLRAFAKSETQARNDPLTGLWNRRSLENQVRDLQRDGTPFSVAYGDLDHFKQLNDKHGHGTGDQALRLFSRVLRDSIRPSDMAARYGGEEFIVVLPDSDTLTARSVLERIRERLALALTSGRVPAFTVSFGLASSVDGDTFDEVVALADAALLDAKAAGRNRVVLVGDSDAKSADSPDDESAVPPPSEVRGN